MSLLLDPVTTAWMQRGRAISAELAGGPEDDRARARILSDRLFSEYGDRRVWPVTITTHLVTVGDHEIRVREYRPDDGLAQHPAYLLFHGGGFSTGSIDEDINLAFCSQRAVGSGFSVFDVDYRLAPEHRYPAGLDDAFGALEWVAANSVGLGLTGRIVVGGVSAGGNIAAALCLVARDRGGPGIHAQLLEVPVTDMSPGAPWIEDYGIVNGLAHMEGLASIYADDAHLTSEYVSPLRAPTLTNLPQAHVMTAEWDPLREGGEAYVHRLRDAGVDVTATRHLAQLHGSAGLTRHTRSARLWHAEVVAVLREFGLD